MNIATTTIEDAAKLAAGNHRKFESFAWYDRPEDDENWTLVYTHNRDSGLIDQSNASVVEKALEAFPEDAIAESHNHWLVGHVDGYAIRVYREGQITDAFRCYIDLMQRQADYALLDEEDYSRREYEATLEHIADNRPRKPLVDLPDGWASQVLTWLWDNNQSAVENVDDQGGYPSDDDILEALIDLGIVNPETDLE